MIQMHKRAMKRHTECVQPLKSVSVTVRMSPAPDVCDKFIIEHTFLDNATSRLIMDREDVEELRQKLFVALASA